MIRVLFVCMGNICRSPTAHGVFESLVRQAALSDQIQIDSAGTHAYHVGEMPDARAQQEARRRGFDLSAQRARRVADTDFDEFDYILAMDTVNMEALRARCPARHVKKIHFLLEFASGIDDKQVPDPYYGGNNGFGVVLDLVESGASGFLAFLKSQHKI